MVSGVAATLRRLVRALESRGHATRVYTATYPDDPTGPDRVHRSASIRFFLDPKIQWAFPRRRRIVDDLRSFAPDVVHVMTEFAMGYAGVRAARELGIPVVASAHTDYERYSRLYRAAWALAPGWRYLRWFYGHAAVVLCPSRSYERHLQRRGIRHTARWTRGVDTREFSPEHRSRMFRERFGVSEDDVLIAYVGRFGPEKRIGVLLDAWERLAPRHPGASLVFVGQGLMEEEMRGRALPRTHFAGVLYGLDLSRAYASADILAFPSDTETFGNVLLEGMASGLACVAARAGGPLEFAHHDENALLVPPRDAAALADAIERLITDPVLRRTLAAGARDTARGRSWETIYDDLVAQYERAAAADVVTGRAS